MTDNERLFRAPWSAVVYITALTYLGLATWWKAVCVGLLVWALIAIPYGGRWVERAGFLLLVATVLVWLGIAPPVQQWPAALAQLKQTALVSGVLGEGQ